MQKVLLIAASLLILTNCGRESTKNKAFGEKSYALFKGGSKPAPSKDIVVKTDKKQEKVVKMTEEKQAYTPELDFKVKNDTGKTIYVSCFSYIQKVQFTRWHWDKSPIYKLEPDDTVVLNIDTIPDNEHRDDVFGYLTIFEDEKQAHDSIYELVKDNRKIDLDRLSNLKDKTVIVSIEKYGIHTEKYDFDVVDEFKKKELHPELDFVLENGTGKTLYVAGFVYQSEDNIRTVWEYEKTPVQRLEPGQKTIIDVNTITEPRDRIYMHGFLGVFEEHEEQLAHDSTYELLLPKNRITLGRLSKIKDNKIIIQVEKYGAVGDITEFDVKPAQSPFAKN